MPLDRDNTSVVRRRDLPWHAWVAAIPFLLLYGAGAYDYIMVLRMDEGYFEAQGWGESVREYFGDYPVGTRILWTINILAGLAAPLLLLLRSRLAAPVASTSALAQAVLMAITFAFMGRLAALGPSLAGLDAGILVVTIVFWLYCRWLERRRT